MQGVCEIHAAIGEVKSSYQSGGVFSGDARQAQKRSKRGDDFMAGKIVNTPQYPFAFEQYGCAYEYVPRVHHRLGLRGLIGIIGR